VWQDIAPVRGQQQMQRRTISATNLAVLASDEAL
jgi:hypothetical protein